MCSPSWLLVRSTIKRRKLSGRNNFLLIPNLTTKKEIKMRTVKSEIDQESERKNLEKERLKMGIHHERRKVAAD
jgi:hypothetical protein